LLLNESDKNLENDYENGSIYVVRYFTLLVCRPVGHFKSNESGRLSMRMLLRGLHKLRFLLLQEVIREARRDKRRASFLPVISDEIHTTSGDRWVE